MNDILIILQHAFWCSMASLGFAILFSTPKRVLPYITACGFIAGLIKFTILSPLVGGGIVLASLTGSLTIGFMSLFISHWSHATPIVISISGVISFVPGSFAFKSMMGFIKFIRHEETEIIIKSAHHATMAFFIILMIALGVALPRLLLRIDSVKNKFILGGRRENE